MKGVIRPESIHFYLTGIINDETDNSIIPKEIQDELKNEIVRTFRDLLNRHCASIESLILASTYIASRKLGIELDPTQINKLFGTHNLRWVNILRDLKL